MAEAERERALTAITVDSYAWWLLLKFVLGTQLIWFH